MKRVCLILAALLAFAASANAQNKHVTPPPIHNEKGVNCTPFNPNHIKHARGMVKTPRYKLLAAPRFKATKAAPSQVLMLPKKLSMWGNDQYGDCVTAQECASKAAYSVYCGLPETFIPESTAITWARQNGFLNGADLQSVMDKMASLGIVADDGKTYKDGPYFSVNFSNEQELQSALADGPINLGMDADALPSGAGNQSGWYAFGGTPGRFTNEDHCCALFGFGPKDVVAKALGEAYGVTVTLPASAPATVYLYFTWNTVGIVDHAWLMSTVGETYVRKPTTVGQSPTPTPNPPPPPPPPVPNGPVTITLTPEQVKAVIDAAGTNGVVITPNMTIQQLIDAMQKAPAPKKTSAIDRGSAELVVYLPQAATLHVEGQPTTSKGEKRRLVTPELRSGVSYVYDVTATLDGRTQTHQAIVRRGETTQVSFDFPALTATVSAPRYAAAPAAAC